MTATPSANSGLFTPVQVSGVLTVTSAVDSPMEGRVTSEELEVINHLIELITDLKAEVVRLRIELAMVKIFTAADKVIRRASEH